MLLGKRVFILSILWDKHTHKHCVGGGDMVFASDVVGGTYSYHCGLKVFSEY